MNKMETNLYTVLTYFISFGAYCYRYPTKSKSFAQRHPSGVRVMGLRQKYQLHNRITCGASCTS